MNVSPADFERLTTGWLIVDGPDPGLVALVGKEGSVLLTVTTECEHPNATKPRYTGGNYGHYGTQNCPDCGGIRDDWSTWSTATRSVRVRLTGQPLPMLDGGTKQAEYPPDALYFTAGEGWWQDSNFEHVIDLGPDPVSLVGRWAFPVEQMT